MRDGQIGLQIGVVAHQRDELAIVAQGVGKDLAPQPLGPGNRGELFGMAGGKMVHHSASLPEMGLAVEEIRLGFGQRGLGLGVFPGDQERAHRQARHRQQQHRRRRAHGRLVPPGPLAGPIRQRRPAGQHRLAAEEPPQVVGHLARPWRSAARGSLAIAFSTIVSRSTGTAGFDPPRRTGLLVGDPPEELLAIVPVEGVLQREQFVERDAQRIDVGALVDQARLAGRLLGTHVAQRAHHVAGDASGRPRSGTGPGRNRSPTACPGRRAAGSTA